MKKMIALFLVLVSVTVLLPSCDMSTINGAYGNGDESVDQTIQPGEETTPETAPETIPETEEPPLVLSHTFQLSGPYDVKGGYISGSSTPSVDIDVLDVFDLEAISEVAEKCRIQVTYTATVQGDHLNLQFAMDAGFWSVLKADYRYLDHNESAVHTFSAADIALEQLIDIPRIRLSWVTKGITSFDGINHCKITDIYVHVEFYSDVHEDFSEEDMSISHVYQLPEQYTVRGGYISGTTTPSVDLDLTEFFDLQTLADQGYYCHIYVYYDVEVKGDHLNLRCCLDGITERESRYKYLENDESTFSTHTQMNIEAIEYSGRPTVQLKWNCKGVTDLDGLNECVISNVSVTVFFTPNRISTPREWR